MSGQTSSPSHTASNDQYWFPPALGSSSHNLQQSVPAQGNSSTVHVLPQSVTSTPSQDQVAQAAQLNPHRLPQPSDHFCLYFSMQGNISPIYLPPTPQFIAFAPTNAPTPPQPPPHVFQEIVPVEEDARSVHISPELVSPAPSQNPPAQTEEHIPAKNPACRYCENKFRRKQELVRHLRTNLPHWIHCPSPRCPWTGNRHYSLAEHMNGAHTTIRKPQRNEWQIYDREVLVESMAGGTLTVVEAADNAMSMVNERFSEPDKVGVKANVWGSRRKFCTGEELVLIH